MLVPALFNLLAQAPSALDEDFSPGLGLFALLVLFVAVILLAIVALLVVVLIILFALGLMSTSAAVGLAKRSPVSGIQAFFLQLGAIAGALCGVAAAMVINRAVQANWSLWQRVILGSGAGLVCGLATAWVFNMAWIAIAKQIAARTGVRTQP